MIQITGPGGSGKNHHVVVLSACPTWDFCKALLTNHVIVSPLSSGDNVILHIPFIAVYDSMMIKKSLCGWHDESDGRNLFKESV